MRKEGFEIGKRARRRFKKKGKTIREESGEWKEEFAFRKRTSKRFKRKEVI